VKIALITDTHWGIRNDSSVFHDNNKKFLDDVFFPELERNGIDTIIHLGDLVDRRKYINYLTAKRLREDFLEPIAERGIEMHIIAGNHDVFYKNTNEVNSLRELVIGKYEKMFVWDELPINWRFGETNILMLPWICDDNREESYNAIKNSKASIVMGHLELTGFEMFKGSVNTHGDDPRIFDRFDLVCSGHFHHRSTVGNISYLGSHAEFTWSDYDDPRGFHILDTDTRELTFIQNPYTMFKKIWYNDEGKFITEVLDVNTEQYKDKFVKVIVTNKTNPYWFDMFIENLEKIGISNLQIVEDHLNLALEEDGDIVDEAESTIDIFKKYIGQYNLPDSNRIKLENVIVELYNEALTIE
jgi:DNA repair exonuclease SbcCD nuclease subunit